MPSFLPRLSLYQKKNISRCSSRVEQFQQIERIKTINHFCSSILQRGELLLHLVFPNHFPDQIFSFFPFSSSPSSTKIDISNFAKTKIRNVHRSLEKRVPRDEQLGKPSFQPEIISLESFPTINERARNQQIFHDNWKFPDPVNVIVNRKHRFEESGNSNFNPLDMEQL